MINNVLTLLKLEKSTDDAGNVIETVAGRKQVFVADKSIGQKEVYEALAVGLKPEIKFVLSDYIDYEDERAVEFEGERYNVIRTHRKEGTTKIELVVSKNARA